MFEVGSDVAGGVPLSPSSADLVAFVAALRKPDPALDDAARIERIHRLEQMKAAVSAAQAVEVAAFVESRRAVARAEVASVRRPGIGKRRRLAEAERGIVSDVAVARRESPGQASRFISFATTAPAELAASFGLLARGEVSERRLLTLHRATSCLEPDQRRQVDAEVAPKLTGWGDRQVLAEAQAAGYRIDPKGACARAAMAAKDRCVSVRPAPETMSRLSAVLPLTAGVAVFAALDRAARSAAAAGDPRSRAQVMADTLVERVTGQVAATEVPIAIQLVMTDQTLLGRGEGADEPARLVGGLGWLPAPMARDLVLGGCATGTGSSADGQTGTGSSTDGQTGTGSSTSDETGTGSSTGTGSTISGSGGDDDGTCNSGSAAARTVRRLFTDRAGRLIAMESTSRLFTPAMADFIRIRDDVCRTPWCDAPIRHIDHVEPAGDGGATSVGNGRGLCAHCNLAAQASGSVSRPVRDVSGAHTVLSLTPLGQLVRSHAPEPPGVEPARRPVAEVVDLVWEPVPQRHAA